MSRGYGSRETEDQAVSTEQPNNECLSSDENGVLGGGPLQEGPIMA